MSSEKDDKTEKDYRKVDQPKADAIFSEPNDLAEALKNLEDYEDWSNTDNLFQSTDADRLVVEKHTPFEDADKAEKVKKEAYISIAPVPPGGSTPFTSPKLKARPPVAPIESSEKGNLVDVKAAKENTQSEVKKVKNVENELTELMEILKDSDVYAEYLGLTDADFGDERVNTKEAPMDGK